MNRNSYKEIRKSLNTSKNSIHDISFDEEQKSKSLMEKPNFDHLINESPDVSAKMQEINLLYL